MASERLSDGWVHRLALEPGLRPYANDAHDLACEVEVLRAENAELHRTIAENDADNKRIRQAYLAVMPAAQSVIEVIDEVSRLRAENDECQSIA